MEVNFNNLRLMAIKSYSGLAKSLNNSTDKNENISTTVYDIEEYMDDLRNMLVTIACTYEPGDENFKDLSDEIGVVTVFNDDDKG